jgi:chitinase
MSSSSKRSRMSNLMYTNAVYFPSHRIYQGDTPGMLNYSCINHVYYAYARVAADGVVYVCIKSMHAVS